MNENDDAEISADELDSGETKQAEKKAVLRTSEDAFSPQSGGDENQDDSGVGESPEESDDADSSDNDDDLDGQSADTPSHVNADINSDELLDTEKNDEKQQSDLTGPGDFVKESHDPDISDVSVEDEVDLSEDEPNVKKAAFAIKPETIEPEPKTQKSDAKEEKKAEQPKKEDESSEVEPSLVINQDIPKKVDEKPVPETSVAALASASTNADTTSSNRSNKQKILMFVALPFLALVLIGGISFAGYVYYQLNKPENVLAQSVASTFDAITSTEENIDLKKFEFNGKLDITSVDGSGDPVSLDLSGAVDSTQSAFEVNLDIDLVITKLMLSLASYDNDLFVKVGGLEGLGQVSAANDPSTAALFGAVNNNWISLDPALLGTLGVGLPVADETIDVNSDERKEIVQAFIDHRFVELVEDMGAEDIDGTSTHHFKVKINSEELKAFVKKVENINGAAYGIDDQFVSMVNMLARTIDSTDYSMEVWIGKEDRFMRKIIVGATVGDAKYDLALNMTGINSDTNLSPPAEPLSLLELLGPLLESGGNPLELLDGFGL